MNEREATQARTTRRTVIAAHLVLTLYGHWAVNDPRGSGSQTIRQSKLNSLGPIHRGRRPPREQPSRSELRHFHAEHEAKLEHPVFWIDEALREQASLAIDEVIRAQGYTCYACAICANHIHLLIRTHRDRARQMWQHFAGAIQTRLRHRETNGVQLAADHPILSSRPYAVLLFTPHDVWRVIDYIEQNPIREGKPAQQWAFITEYNNWPGHRSGA